MYICTVYKVLSWHLILSPSPITSFDWLRVKKKLLMHMKLQKLVFYAQGWHLGLNNSPLINEPIEAWKYGPVVRSLYREFREFGNSAINRLASDYDPELEEIYYPDIPETEEYARTFLDKIWAIYRDFTSIQLSNMTHAPGTPWARVNHQYNGDIPRGVAIPDEWMAEFFRKEAERT